MEGLVQAKQELLEEVLTLRTRVVELEKAETEQRQWSLCEHALRYTLTQTIEQQRHSISASQAQVRQLETIIETLQANAQALCGEKQRMDVRLRIANHDLRNSLVVIQGNVQLAKRRLKHMVSDQALSPEVQELLDQVQEVLRRAEEQMRVQNSMINDLLICTEG